MRKWKQDPQTSGDLKVTQTLLNPCSRQGFKNNCDQYVKYNKRKDGQYR